LTTSGPIKGQGFCGVVVAVTRYRRGSAMSVKDHYRVLGVSPLAALEDIHKSYRTLAKLYHPDIAKEKILADQKMKEITEAYNVLKDVGRRKEYDNSRLFKYREFKKVKGSAQKKKLGFFESLFGKKDQKPKGIQKSFRDKNPIEFSFTMGITYAMTRKPNSVEAAVQEFKRITELDPKNRDAFYNMGLSYYLLGNFNDAIMAFKRVMTLDPQDPDAKLVTGMLIEDSQ
jgi:curved DNA-binding protein CbpA